jgi:hypothetical protein
MNIFKLYLSILEPMNIKSYLSVWAMHQRIYGPCGLTLTGPYIHRWIHITDEYKWHIFINDMASSIDIWGAGLPLHVYLYSSVAGFGNRCFLFLSSPRALHFICRPVPPLCKMHRRLRPLPPSAVAASRVATPPQPPCCAAIA